MKNIPFLKRFVLGPLEVNTYLIADITAGDHPAAVIDPAGESVEIDKIIEEQELNLQYIINTHGHIDHIAFNKPFKDKYNPEILIHSADAEWLGIKQDEYLFDMVGATVSPEADILLKEGDDINIGDITLRVLHTPGHTRGSITLLYNKTAITGDTLFASGVGRTDLPGGSYDRLMDSIHNILLKLPDDTKIYPGHGEESTIGEEKLNNPFLQI